MLMWLMNLFNVYFKISCCKIYLVYIRPKSHSKTASFPSRPKRSATPSIPNPNSFISSYAVQYTLISSCPPLLYFSAKETVETENELLWRAISVSTVDFGDSDRASVDEIESGLNPISK